MPEILLHIKYNMLTDNRPSVFKSLLFDEFTKSQATDLHLTMLNALQNTLKTALEIAHLQIHVY